MAGPAADRGAGVRTDQILAAVRSRGGRATPAKRILVTVLLASAGHQTAEDIGAAVRTHAPGVALTTIYRNLEELERLGMVDKTRTTARLPIICPRLRTGALSARTADR